jgi:hypothetical protein
MNEIWKDVIGYEGSYEVSNLGNVRSVDRLVSHTSSPKGRLMKGKLIKPNIKKYVDIHLWRKSKYKSTHVHRLVALSFIPNPENKPEVNHMDGNKLNNNVNNLEWVTKKENIEHAIKLGLKPDQKGANNYFYKHGKYIKNIVK